MYKRFNMNGHKLQVLQLDKGSVRRCIAVLDDEKNLAYLISYYTVVAVYDKKCEKLYRTWPDWSRTTARHVSLFAKFMYNDCNASFSYYDWKQASRDYSEYGRKCLPFDFLVREARVAIPCNDKYVNWRW